MTNEMTVMQDIIKVPIEQLLLDAENPRFGGSTVDLDQEALLKELYGKYYLDDLLVSMARNGYFSEEPLIGVPAGTDREEKPLYTVVEGNRRLTALRLLVFPTDREKLGARGIPEATEDVLDSLRQVPVKVYPTRTDVTPYMGVRHIAGVRPWDAMAKACYIKHLVDEGYQLETIKDMVGIRRGDVVQRWLLTLYVLLQANQIADKPWNTSEEGLRFSFLYTALGYQRVRAYLGIESSVLQKPCPDPVPEASHGKLIEHMTDLYGGPGESRLRKINESREIKQLAAVYATPEALDMLRSDHTLSEAFSRSVGEEEELTTLIRDASYNLDKACGLAPHHKRTPEARKYAKRCLVSAQHLCDTLEE